jgi:hypothetical protein
VDKKIKFALAFILPGGLVILAIWYLFFRNSANAQAGGGASGGIFGTPSGGSAAGGGSGLSGLLQRLGIGGQSSTPAVVVAGGSGTGSGATASTNIPLGGILSGLQNAASSALSGIGNFFSNGSQSVQAASNLSTAGGLASNTFNDLINPDATNQLSSLVSQAASNSTANIQDDSQALDTSNNIEFSDPSTDYTDSTNFFNDPFYSLSSNGSGLLVPTSPAPSPAPITSDLSNSDGIGLQGDTSGLGLFGDTSTGLDNLGLDTGVGDYSGEYTPAPIDYNPVPAPVDTSTDFSGGDDFSGDDFSF